MSRLHACAATPAAISARFGIDPVPDVGIPEETVEGTTGIVVFETDGRRQLKRMTWGFPRFTRAMHRRGEAPERLGLVADLTNPMWDEMVRDPRYRCLIPIIHFANPDGAPGRRTRTWFSIPGDDGNPAGLMAWAGFCRSLAGHGACHAGMTMTANDAVLPTNDRMPVLLAPHEYGQWLHGGVEDVIRFQFRPPVDARTMVVTPTKHLWRSGKGPPRSRAILPESVMPTARAQFGLDL